MILAIDCGNTHVTVGCVADDCTVCSVFRIPTDRGETEFGYAAKINQILGLQKIDLALFEGAVISCVVPPVTNVLVRAVRLLIGSDPLVLGAGVKTGLHVCINDPGTVASDLVAAAVEAKERYPLPCVIVDMGTATTLTVLDERGRFIGGAIYPGVGISLESLSTHTALLPSVEITPPKSAVAANTAECMRSGIVYGSAGAVDGILDHFEKELAICPATMVATGGTAHLIAPHCRHALILDETLLLRGLKRVWDKNKKEQNHKTGA